MHDDDPPGFQIGFSSASPSRCRKRTARQHPSLSGSNHTIDDEFGGFRGQIANDLTIDPQAAKGLILNARILWTFSSAFSVYRDPIYLETARRAYDYLIRCFLGSRIRRRLLDGRSSGPPPRHQKAHLRPGLHRLRARRIRTTPAAMPNRLNTAMRLVRAD